jgi:hypothetical protein
MEVLFFMATRKTRTWETYRLGNAVRLRRVGTNPTIGPVAAKPAAVVVEPEPVIDETLTKADLIAEAEKRGLDRSGTKADLVERING